MRHYLLAFAFVGLFSGLSGHVAQAAPAPREGVTAANSPIVQVDRRCGRGRHFVGRHRDRRGHIIPGRCVPNR